MCNWNNNFVLRDAYATTGTKYFDPEKLNKSFGPWNVVCCNPDSDSTYCKPSDGNKEAKLGPIAPNICQQSPYAESGLEWYSKAPLQEDRCGDPTMKDNILTVAQVTPLKWGRIGPFNLL